MKTFFTFIFALIISICSSAQKSGSLTVGMNTQNQLFSIKKAYPNPVTDFVTIEFQSVESGEVQISLINILGSEVKKWDGFFLNEGNQELKIDLSQFKSGIYILRMTKQGQIRTQVLKKS